MVFRVQLHVEKKERVTLSEYVSGSRRHHLPNGEILLLMEEILHHLRCQKNLYIMR